MPMDMGEVDAGFFEYGALLHYTGAPATTFVAGPLVFAEYVLLVDPFQRLANTILQAQQVAGYGLYVGFAHIGSIRESVRMLLFLLPYNAST